MTLEDYIKCYSGCNSITKAEFKKDCAVVHGDISIYVNNLVDDVIFPARLRVNGSMYIVEDCKKSVYIQFPKCLSVSSSLLLASTAIDNSTETLIVDGRLMIIKSAWWKLPDNLVLGEYFWMGSTLGHRFKNVVVAEFLGDELQVLCNKREPYVYFRGFFGTVEQFITVVHTMYKNTSAATRCIEIVKSCVGHLEDLLYSDNWRYTGVIQ